MYFFHLFPLLIIQWHINYSLNDVFIYLILSLLTLHSSEIDSGLVEPPFWNGPRESLCEEHIVFCRCTFFWQLSHFFPVLNDMIGPDLGVPNGSYDHIQMFPSHEALQAWHGKHLIHQATPLSAVLAVRILLHNNIYLISNCFILSILIELNVLL